MELKIDPEPPEEVRAAIEAALEARIRSGPTTVEQESCAAAVEIIPPAPPRSPSARSA